MKACDKCQKFFPILNRVVVESGEDFLFCISCLNIELAYREEAYEVSR